MMPFSAFARLVQSKRCKMLVLVLLLLAALVGGGYSSINLTYVLRRGGAVDQPTCLAEENERYEAIGWVLPLPKFEKDVPKFTYKFKPYEEGRPTYDCNFEPHEKCNSVWKISGWELEESRDLVLDSRWENFPHFLTNRHNKEFKHKFDLNPENSSAQSIAFSVLAEQDVQLFLCEGWNPHEYQSYQFIITQLNITLNKLKKYQSNMASTDNLRDYYKTFSNILSKHEWRNFILKYTSTTLELVDVTQNRTVIEYNVTKEADAAFTPAYLFIRSEESALWKVHENSYMSTKKAQLSRMGPQLKITHKDLCISLMVAMCESCAMEFKTLINDEMKILKEVEASAEHKWRLVKLKYENYPYDNITIFVETKLGNQNQSGGFWAYDDVRICHENEVKVTFFDVSSDNEGNETEMYSCQVVGKPKLRPHRMDEAPPILIDHISVASTNETAIELNWAEEDAHKKISYFITYEANDICPSFPYNMKRIKSNGFLVTKQNEIVIADLVPYTKYNISLSSIFHEKIATKATTLESKEVTLEELPNKIQVQVADRTAAISWEKVDCQQIYGPLIYNISVTNLKTNQRRHVKVQMDNALEIFNLDTFTQYQVEIITARNEKDLNNPTSPPMLATFSTKAGLAATVENLQVYSTDSTSISLRYDLPKDPHGVPVSVKLRRCYPLLYKKCKEIVSQITACHLWPNKFCLDVNDIAPNQTHTLKISVRNDGSPDFGKEVEISAETIDRVPNPPENLSVSIVNCTKERAYCNLDVAWAHPSYPNGTITAFVLFLNSTDGVKEIYRVPNKMYEAKYRKQIKFVPYSPSYDVHIESKNLLFSSAMATVHFDAEQQRKIEEEPPKLVAKNESSASFVLGAVDGRFKSYKLKVVVQDYDEEVEVVSDEALDKLCHKYGKTWTDGVVQVGNDTRNLVVGHAPLKENTEYCVTFIATYVDGYNKAQQFVYHANIQTDKSVSYGKYNHLWVLLLLLLLVPLGFLLYRRYGRRMCRKPENKLDKKENEYETLPFDDCEMNCVNNDNYDHLVHK